MNDEREVSQRLLADHVALCNVVANWINEIIDLNRFEDEEVSQLIMRFAKLLRDAYQEGYAQGLRESKSAPES